MEQVTFSGSYAGETGQPVLYVTERCVLRRTAEGVELAEVAPGVDIERDILAQMDFRPIVRATPRPMDPRIFRPGPMGLEETLLGLGLADRISYDAERNIAVRQLRGLPDPHAARTWSWCGASSRSAAGRSDARWR